MNRSVSSTALLLTCISLFLATAMGQASNEETAIKQALETYAKAFNSNDAAALSKLWAEDAEYTDDNGETYKGRKEIQTVFLDFFTENKGVQLKLDISKVNVSSPSKAIVQGTSVVSIPGQKDDRSDFVANMVKVGQAWQIANVGEVSLSPNYVHLKELESLIGEWAGRGEAGELEWVSQWTANKSFITSYFSIRTEDTELEGTLIIGWDPIEKRITSWMFDSAGGYASGIWSKEGSGWQVKLSRVLNDGTKGSEVHSYERVQDTLVWKAFSRMVSGEKLPDIGSIKAERRQGDTQ